MPVRLARIEDTREIARVKQAVWPDDTADPDRIASVIQDPSHATYVAIDGGQVVGFVDGFATVSQSGVKRWEVDLLAVDPRYQGRGIAKALIGACTQHGRQYSAAFARALIQTENIPSQRAFDRSGYAISDAAYLLFVLSDDDISQVVAAPDNLYRVPVSTLNYQGIWLEGTLSPDAFAFARCDVHDRGLDTAGAVIREADHATVAAAQSAGYHFVARYHWWQREFK